MSCLVNHLMRHSWHRKGVVDIRFLAGSLQSSPENNSEDDVDSVDDKDGDDGYDDEDDGDEDDLNTEDKNVEDDDDNEIGRDDDEGDEDEFNVNKDDKKFVGGYEESEYEDKLIFLWYCGHSIVAYLSGREATHTDSAFDGMNEGLEMENMDIGPCFKFREEIKFENGSGGGGDDDE